MAETVTQGQFYEAMRTLEAQMQLHHKNQREHIDDRCDKILTVFRGHEMDYRELCDRVLTIETERKGEKEVATRRAAVAGSVAAGALLGLIEALKRMLGAHP